MSAPEHLIEMDLRLPVPPETAYAAWTDIALLRRWFGDNVEADVRVGGRYRAENRDGDKVYVHEGHYLALEPNRLVRMSFAVPNAPDNGYTYRDEFIEMRFEPASDGTLLRFANGWNGDAASAADEAAVRAAWAEWLGLMKAQLASPSEHQKGDER